MTPTRELFERHRLRCTQQRLALYEALAANKRHPTAEELFQGVRHILPGISRATVYNTLEALCKSGLARRMPMGDGCNRYDADVSEHLHVRMRDSSEIHDVPADLGDRFLLGLPADVIGEIERAFGMKIDAISVQLHGSRASE